MQLALSIGKKYLQTTSKDTTAKTKSRKKGVLHARPKKGANHQSRTGKKRDDLGRAKKRDREVRATWGRGGEKA